MRARAPRRRATAAGAAGRSRTLKALLQETRVPLADRARVPLLFAGGQLVAVADLWNDASIRRSRGQQEARADDVATELTARSLLCTRVFASLLARRPCGLRGIDFPSTGFQMSRFVFVTGGVVSSLGKGIASASLGAILEARGLKVTMVKLDPYINVDPGTMSPFQHGEVFVTDDGAETDLDLGPLRAVRAHHR